MVFLVFVFELYLHFYTCLLCIFMFQVNMYVFVSCLSFVFAINLFLYFHCWLLDYGAVYLIRVCLQFRRKVGQWSVGWQRGDDEEWSWTFWSWWGWSWGVILVHILLWSVCLFVCLSRKMITSLKGMSHCLTFYPQFEVDPSIWMLTMAMAIHIYISW